MEAGKQQPRVLVVDDDEDACDILSEVLKHLGYTPVCIRDSTAVIPRLRNDRFEAVLLDLVMPGLSGFDLLRAMQAGMEQDGVPVIAVSAHNELRHKATDLGFHAFVEKPVELSKLRPLMGALLPAV